MNRGTHWVLLTAVAVGGWMVSNAFSAAKTDGIGTAGTRIAVVDIVKLFNDFKQTKALNAKMEDHRTRLGGEKERRQQEIDAEKAALAAFAPDSADWFKRNEALKKKRFEFEVWQALELDQLGEHHLRWTKRTYQLVTDEVAKVAKKHGVQLVVTREELDMPQTRDTSKLMQAMLQQILGRKVVYSDPSIEITDEVLTNLNDAFEKSGGEKALDPTK
jgi:Skp family chaperone for outer membrane proteins